MKSKMLVTYKTIISITSRLNKIFTNFKLNLHIAKINKTKINSGSNLNSRINNIPLFNPNNKLSSSNLHNNPPSIKVHLIKSKAITVPPL